MSDLFVRDAIFISFSVRVISRWTTRSLLVRLVLEWEEAPRIERLGRRLRVPSRSYSLKDGLCCHSKTNFHTHKGTHINSNRRSAA